jgi:coenzyme PQQ precursor peptide PqqA
MNSEPVDPSLFWRQAAQIFEFLSRCSIKTEGVHGQRFNWRTFLTVFSLSGRAMFVPFARRAKMAWKTPRIVEVPVGMEINMYACAARK